MSETTSPNSLTKSEHILFAVLTIFCVLLSGIWSAVAGWNCHSADGGRGGAIAVAISFAALFLLKDYGSVIYKLVAEDAPAVKERLGLHEPTNSTDKAVVLIDKRLRQAEARTSAINAQLAVSAQGQRCQNVYLAIAAIVGTLFWGFGDWAAVAFEPSSGCKSVQTQSGCVAAGNAIGKSAAFPMVRAYTPVRYR